MSDRSPTASVWPLLCGIMVLLTAISCTAAMILYLRLQDILAGQANWQRRWQVDTAQITEEMKAAAQKMADESYARVEAEIRIAALQTQIEELTRALAEAQRKPGAPTAP